MEWQKVQLSHQNGQSYPDAVENLKNPTSRPTQEHQMIIEMPSEMGKHKENILILCYKKPFIGPIKKKFSRLYIWRRFLEYIECDKSTEERRRHKICFQV
jgi:hypothetical protein